MTLSNRSLFLLALFLSCTAGITRLSAQDDSYYGLDKTIAFGQYLFDSKQYQLAAREFERADFLKPGQDSIRQKLLLSLWRQGAYAQLEKKLFSYHGQIFDQYPESRANLYFNTLLLQDKTGEAAAAITLLSQTPYTAEAKITMQLRYELITGQYERAHLTSQQPGAPASLVALSARSLKLPHRSPMLGGLFSAIVPGTGKIYAGRWQDGLFSLVFVGANTFGAYRGFQQRGIQSISGWIFATLATGFYIGNVYGGWQAVHTFNENQQSTITDALRSAVLTDY